MPFNLVIPSKCEPRSPNAPLLRGLGWEPPCGERQERDSEDANCNDADSGNFYDNKKCDVIPKGVSDASVFISSRAALRDLVFLMSY